MITNRTCGSCKSPFTYIDRPSRDGRYLQNRKTCDSCKEATIARCQQVRTDRREAREKPVRAARTAARRQQVFEKKPWLDPSLSYREKARLRWKLDPTMRIRNAMYKKERRQRIGDRVRKACRQKRDFQGVLKKLGYTYEGFRRHMERQFTPGMTWELFEEGAIHIDHIVALKHFDLSREEELLAAWALSNLQPLWPLDNLKKGDRRTLLL